MLGTEMEAKVTRVRPPTAAGTFYPEDPVLLRESVTALLSAVPTEGPTPRALIVPHAGYPFSGPVAASAYALLQPLRDRIKRVVLLGPSHFCRFSGLAAPKADALATPLGAVKVDLSALEALRQWPQVQVLDQAHQREHSLEVQLPFLQLTLGEFSLVPLVTGLATASEVENVLQTLWTGHDTLVVVSSDLCHDHDYPTTRAIDRETAELIEHLHWQMLHNQRACGYCGIRGLLKLAQQRKMQVKALDLRNSGDTADWMAEAPTRLPRVWRPQTVVGYGSFVVCD